MSDIKLQYILQAISNAANNLRLSSEKIEVVALLKEHLENSQNLAKEIQRLKTITEFSRFAIRLWELLDYISNSRIDFLKISEQFKTHSHLLVKDLSTMLDVVTPQTFHDVISKSNNTPENIEHLDYEVNEEPANISLGQSDVDELNNPEHLKEKFILEDLKTDVQFDFDNYLQTVLAPIKPLDSFLNLLLTGKFKIEQLEEYYDIIRQNTLLSRKAGLDLITKMHVNLYLALEGILHGKLNVNKDLIEMMRACLIVIVAIVRGKEVDISSFITRAERLSELLEN